MPNPSIRRPPISQSTSFIIKAVTISRIIKPRPKSTNIPSVATFKIALNTHPIVGLKIPIRRAAKIAAPHPEICTFGSILATMMSIAALIKMDKINSIAVIDYLYPDSLAINYI